jgi:hypothetical protein
MCCCMEIISQTLCKNNLVSENVSMYVLFQLYIRFLSSFQFMKKDHENLVSDCMIELRIKLIVFSVVTNVPSLINLI